MKFLSQYLKFSFFAGLFLFSLSALAQAFPEAPVLVGAPSNEEISAFLTSLKGLSGPLVIALAAAQGLILVARYFGLFQKLTQRWGLALAAFLHIGTGIITLLIAGQNWQTILVGAPFLTLLGNYLFQIYQAFMTKKGEQ